MTWNFWDVVIILIALVNIGTLIALVLAVLHVKNNTVTWATGRANSLVARAKTLAQAGKSVYSTNRELVTELAAEITGLRTSLHGDNFRTPFAEQPISYAKAFALLATARKVQSGWALFSSVRRTGIKAALASANPLKAKPQKGPARRSFADRLGLLPPAARHLGPIVRVARMAFGVRQQLKARGLI